MAKSRRRPWFRFGATLAGMALYLQLAFASWSLVTAAPPGGPDNEFHGHALCLAGQIEDAAPAAPAGAPTAPAHVHDALCCLFHPLPAVPTHTAAVPLPVSYAEIGHSGFRGASPVSTLRHDPRNARAPPRLT